MFDWLLPYFINNVIYDLMNDSVTAWSIWLFLNRACKVPIVSLSMKINLN